MKSKPQLAAIFVAACVSFCLGRSTWALPANPPQDQATPQTPSEKRDKKQKAESGPGKDVGKGGEDVGKGVAKGAESLGKGAAGAAGNLATLHPANAAVDLGKGTAGAGKDVGIGAGKGAIKIGEGSAKGVGKLGGKIFHKGKNKDKNK